MSTLLRFSRRWLHFRLSSLDPFPHRLLSASLYRRILLGPPETPTGARWYGAESRILSPFDENIVRILRNEIEYQCEYAPPHQPVLSFNGFAIEDRPGEQCIRLKAKFHDKEDIKIDATTFDGYVSVPKYGDDTDGESIRLHMSLIVDVTKGDSSDTLEFLCSAWPDCLKIQKVYKLQKNGMPPMAYMGPTFSHNDKQSWHSIGIVERGTQKVDLMITEVHLVVISGFKLLELVANELDMPVILMSEDSDTRLVMKGITLGASDYFLKPIRMEEVKTIEEVKSREAHKDEVEGCVEKEKVGKKRKDPTWEDDKENDEGSNPNRNRELHEKFVAAVDTLGGPYKPLPKKIHELMATEGLRIDHKYITVLEKSSKHNSDSKLDGSANPVSITGSVSNEKLDETPDISSSGLVAIDHVDVIPCSITGSTLNQKLNGNPCFSSSGSGSSKLIDPADLQSVNDSVERQNNALESINHPTGQRARSAMPLFPAFQRFPVPRLVQ
ncbi:Two-component response regulator ORR24-like protein, partial [Drosera capensis]